MRMVKTDIPGYFKDQQTGFVINTNDVEYQRILESRKKKNEIENLNKRMSDIETTLSDIKALLERTLLSQNG